MRAAVISFRFALPHVFDKLQGDLRHLIQFLIQSDNMRGFLQPVMLLDLGVYPCKIISPACGWTVVSMRPWKINIGWWILDRLWITTC